MDPIEDALPPKIVVEFVEGECSKAKEKIEQYDHIHVAEIKELIESPIDSEMKINLFLHEWENMKKREIKSLTCKAYLQIEHA